jgi:hypothetical protein
VDVVGYEDVGIKGEVKFLVIVLKSGQIVVIILGLKKDPLFLVSPGQDVIKGAGEFNSRLPCHVRAVFEQKRVVSSIAL